MRARGGLRHRFVSSLAIAALTATIVVAEGPAEPVGKVLMLPDSPGRHWFWLSDIVLHRTALFDGDSGALLGTITSGTPGVGFVILPLFGPARREIYLAESYYSRGVRGERTDVVTVYDGTTLQPLDEIVIPPKRAEYFPGNAANALSDDGRFVAIFNLTPVQSLSIVDVVARRFIAEVPTPGCSLVYAAGPRRFIMLCADGSALVVDLDEEGRASRVERMAPFFDAQKDPVTEKAVRLGGEWLFVSFGGVVHPLDTAASPPRPGETWSLFDDDDRSGSWRIGGGQHLALHAPSSRLYALVHQGGPDTHKDAGTEVWVYDVASRRRTQRISMLSPLASFVRQQARLGQDGMAAWFLQRMLPNLGVDRIVVTQDDRPLLVAAAQLPPTVTVHDATTGAVVREIEEVGLGSSLLTVP